MAIWGRLCVGVSWVLYWLGECAYSLYNKLILWSEFVQGDRVGGPWGPVTEAEGISMRINNPEGES